MQYEIISKSLKWFAIGLIGYPFLNILINFLLGITFNFWGTEYSYKEYDLKTDVILSIPSIVFPLFSICYFRSVFLISSIMTKEEHYILSFIGFIIMLFEVTKFLMPEQSLIVQSASILVKLLNISLLSYCLLWLSKTILNHKNNAKV